MQTSLNGAAERRAAINWAAAVGPLACSGLVTAIALVQAFDPDLPLAALLGDQPLISGWLPALVVVQVPMVWLFVETTAWRRQAPSRRGRRVLAAQALALGVALAALRLGGG